MAADRKLKPGDLIEIYRPLGLYQHWAIYVGDGYVIHVVTASDRANSGTSSVCTGKDGKVTVKKQKLQDVLGNDEYRINNHLDDQYEPRPTDDILQEAKRFVGREFPYNVSTSNCEHFATLLRYGKPHSQQVQEAKKFLFAALAAAATVFGILSIATLRNEDSQDL